MSKIIRTEDLSKFKRLYDNRLQNVLSSSVPNTQATVTVALDARTNLNGRVLTNFEATFATVTIPQQGEYDVYIITEGGEPLTETRARDYMECMTGSRFLPVYIYDKPQNSIFIFADGTIWKPQFAESGDLRGLYLFKIPANFVTPLVIETDTMLDNGVPLPADFSLSESNFAAAIDAFLAGRTVIMKCWNDGDNLWMYETLLRYYSSEGTLKTLSFTIHKKVV